MSRESFARGFCKAAAAHGVDPEVLAKFAQAQAAQSAQQSANKSARRAALRARIMPKMNRLMAGAQKGETRNFSAEPRLQEEINDFMSLGGNMRELQPTSTARA